MTERIDPNMMHRKRCCICEAILPKYKCTNCNLYYCMDHEKYIYYHIDDIDLLSSYRYTYFKCCEYCCGNCKTETCHICGYVDSNLEMNVVDGLYQCKDHE